MNSPANSAGGIRLAVLDMAGTTIDEGGAVYVALANTISASRGEPPPEQAVKRWMGADKREAIAGLLTELGSPPTPGEVDTVFADFSRRLDRTYLATPPQPIAGIESAFAELRSGGVQVFLSTGFSDRVARGLLRQLGWSVGETIDGLVTAEQVGAGRPSPRMIERAMELSGVDDPRRVVVVGDTLRDLESGAKAKVALVVGVLTGAQDRAMLEGGPATHIIDTAASLPALLDQR